MENATKALLMAAGILITIVVLSLAIFTYGSVSNYYQTKQRNVSQEQIAAFNREYSVYDRDDVSGFELVSLINKAIDFNQNKVYGANNTENTEEANNSKLNLGYTEMKIDINLNSPTSSYYGDDTEYSGMALFQSNVTYEYTGKNSGSRKELSEKIKSMQELERRYNFNELKDLTSYISDLKSGNKTVQEITKKNYTIELINIVKYADYLTFKRGVYKCEDMKYDKYGQIHYFKFTQVK